MALVASLLCVVVLVSLGCVCSVHVYGDVMSVSPPFQGFPRLVPLQQAVVVRPQDTVQQVPPGRPVVQQVPPGRPVVQQVPPGRPVVQQVPPGRPVVQQNMEVLYGPRAPVQSVAAGCQESSVLVAVQRDLFGVGRLIEPSAITLGGCAPTGQDDSAQVLVFETELQGCGSALMMTDDELVYTFTLVYAPNEAGAHIIRLNGATVLIECHYLRKYNVSSSALHPSWLSHRSSVPIENNLVFSLTLMSDDWKSERTSNVFALGDLIHIEASVIVANHVPLRVFVDSCVATSVPDTMAVPRYVFIENHGCLVDAKLTGSRSQFMPRTQQDKLHMQMDAFRFSQERSSIVYIMCLLKATVVSASLDLEYKACSFSTQTNRWVAADGQDHMCSCCDGSCVQRKGRDLANLGPYWQSEMPLGPISIQKKQPLPEARVEMQVSSNERKVTGLSPEMVALAAVLSAVGLLCVVLAAVHWWRRHLL